MNNEQEENLGEGGLEGRYANYFKVGYNAFEFVLEFGQLYEEESARLHTRIITTPTYAKALLETMQESVESFEQAFGIILKK
jgi:hypothetical protein